MCVFEASVRFHILRLSAVLIGNCTEEKGGRGYDCYEQPKSHLICPAHKTWWWGKTRVLHGHKLWGLTLLIKAWTLKGSKKLKCWMRFYINICLWFSNFSTNTKVEDCVFAWGNNSNSRLPEHLLVRNIIRLNCDKTIHTVIREKNTFK